MKRTATTTRRLTGLPLLVLAGLVVLGWGLTAQPAQACNGNGVIDQFDEVCDDGNLVDGDGCSSICQLEASSCIDDVTGVTNVCTANDVRIALVLNATDAACELGTTIDLDLIAELEATSAERWDIGVFVALDGGTARTGLCHQQALPPPLAPDLPSCGGTCSVSSDPCLKDEDCPGFVPFPGAGEVCNGGYNPGDVTLNPDGTIKLPFEPGGPFYDGECSEDPADLCGDLEQGVMTYYEFPAPLTVPCQDNDGDGAVDIGSCLSWDNGRSDGGNKPSCLSIGDTEPNTKAKCKCETINIGNVFVAGTILVEKVCDPVDDPQEFAFDTNFDFKAPNVDKNVACGETAESVALEPSSVSNIDYSVVETPVPDGWELTSFSCVSDDDGNPPEDPAAIDLSSGETVTCTFNNEKDANIIVEKVTDPSGDPQLFTFSTDYSADFQLSDGGTNDSGALDPGTYSVSETVPAGWDLTSATCDDDSDPASIDLAAGETVTCTFTNTKDAFIIVDKVTDPSGDPQLFTFSTSYSADFQLADATAPNNSGDLDPGTYSVSETVPAGWDLTSATCSDGSDPASIGLAAGETVTCTFTNTKRGNIVVKKFTDPSGSTQSFDFTASYNAAGFALTDGLSNDSGPLAPGTYSVSEAVPAGWELKSATCDDGSDPASIGLAAGETVTCTFNNEQDAFIIVEKQTDPDGSTQSFDFTASYNAAGFALTDGQTNNSGDLDPGTYSVSETVPTGWELTSATCDDGSDPASIGLAAGETVTCTFNNEQDAFIIVEKQTDPDGSTQSFDFTASYNAAGFALTDGQTNNSGDLDPGTYSVSETVPTGWELTSATCDDGSDPASIGLAAGETVTCTFNNEQDAFIIVEKQTDPDGSTQSFDFTASYNAAGFALTDGQTNNSGALDPGTYSVSETVPAGWELTSATCDDGSPIGAIDLAAGETVTCTFNNTIQRGNIVVVKQTDPDGSDQSFTFAASYDADGFVLTNGQSNDSGPLLPTSEAGTYSVSETVPVGWDLTSAICSDGSPIGAIDLAPSETVTCTFTNTIQRGNIVVVKQTDPDGSDQSFTFAASYDADGFVLTDGQSNDSGPLLPTSEAGTYSVSETVPVGWDLASAICSDGSPISAIDLAPSETVTCTFTNTIQRGNIVVVKQTDPDGSDQSFTFAASYDADGFVLTDGQSNDSGPLLPTSEAGTYSVSETVPVGWDLTSAICSDGSPIGAIDLAPSETVTCTFTNTQRGNIIVAKETLPDGSLQQFTFTGLPSGTIGDGGSLTVNNVLPGQYQSTETVPAGWDLTSISCNDGNSSGDISTGVATFNVEPGETVTCTFTNTERGMADVLKTVSGGLPNGEVFFFEIRQGANASSSGNIIASGSSDPLTGEATFSCVAGDPPCVDVDGMAKLVPDGATDCTDPANASAQGCYQFCEASVMPGWMSSIRDFTSAFPLPANGAFFVPNSTDPLVDNSIYCAPFQLQPGDSLTFDVDNTPPPGGDGRTIGFWKNWSSCSSGNQDPVLDETLAGTGVYCEGESEPSGLSSGLLCVNTCEEARSILDKRDVVSGKKLANDPCYAAASQLLAAELNVESGARVCEALADVIGDTQALLVSRGFDGAGKCGIPKKHPDNATLLDYARQLDEYNNNDGIDVDGDGTPDDCIP